MGAKAYKFKRFIPDDMVIGSTHPSPFSAYKKSKDLPAFIGSNVFRKINVKLEKQGKEGIKW